jgi:hypothetical protein
MLKRTSLLFVAAILMAGMVHAQKIAVTKGQKLETTTSTKTSMEIMGMSIDNESTASSEVEVKDVNANGFLFTNTIKRMVLKMNGFGQDINFDSDKKEDMDGQMGEAMKDKIGKPEEVVVDKQGKVTEVKSSGEKKAGGMGEMMDFSASLMKGQPYPVLIQLPAREVKPGDTWTDSAGTVESVKTVTTYVLKQVSGGEVLVTFTGTMAKSGTVEQQGNEIQMDMNGTVNGEATYEASSGLLKKNTVTSDIKGTLGVMGQNAPMTMKVTANTVAKKL